MATSNYKVIDRTRNAYTMVNLKTNHRSYVFQKSIMGKLYYKRFNTKGELNAFAKGLNSTINKDIKRIIKNYFNGKISRNRR